MSFSRLIYLSCLIGGWSAFVGWLICEILIGRWVNQYALVAIVMATLVAIPIGGGISFAAGLTNPNITILAKRLVLGFAGGLAGGLLGSLVGSCLFAVLGDIPVVGVIGRILGWSLIGIGIGVGVGVSEGILERSFHKMRNGLIGGVIGGFLGGTVFIPASMLFSEISSRALSFVLLGLSIGLFIGLAQVILKETWLTVEEGFRAGRQIILSQDVATMGTSEKSSLIFIAFGAKGVEPTHVKITKQKEGGYVLEDNQSRTGTLLNGQKVNGPTPLSDGDAIKFGINVVRFNERTSHSGSAGRPPAPKAPAPAMKPAPVSSAAVQEAPPKPAPVKAAPKPAAVAPAPKPAAVAPAQKPAAPAAPAQPQEGRCPICDRKIVGIPGERRCGKCFTTF